MSTASSLALLRIETKLDVLLHVLREQNPVLDKFLREAGPVLLQLPEEDRCALCGEPIHISGDFAAEEYVRSCACRPAATIVTGISRLLEPPKAAKASTKNPDSEEEHSDAEDQDPSTGRSQNPPVHLL